MVLNRSMRSLPLWDIAAANLRHNFLPQFALASLLALITPLLFGITNLDAVASAVPLELLVCLTGMVLFPLIFQPEQTPALEEVVQAKYVSSFWIYTVRAACSLLAVIALVGAVGLFMRAGGCAVTLTLLFGTLANAVFLGGLGMVTAAALGNIAAAYMVPFLYYALNFTGGSRFGRFYLFSMMSGAEQPKIWLFAAGSFLIVFALCLKWFTTKMK